MADNSTSTVSNDPPSKGKAAIPEPTFCKAKINGIGMCESAEKAIESDRNLRASLKLQEDPELVDWIYQGWKTKDHLISELTSRILEWNEMKCPECHANLKGKGPQVLNEHEVKYYQDHILAGGPSDTAAQSKSSDAATRLREILTKSQKGKFLGFL